MWLSSGIMLLWQIPMNSKTKEVLKSMLQSIYSAQLSILLAIIDKFKLFKFQNTLFQTTTS
jgi:hypothetical protein